MHTIVYMKVLRHTRQSTYNGEKTAAPTMLIDQHTIPEWNHSSITGQYTIFTRSHFFSLTISHWPWRSKFKIQSSPINPEVKFSFLDIKFIALWDFYFSVAQFEQKQLRSVLLSLSSVSQSHSYKYYVWKFHVSLHKSAPTEEYWCRASNAPTFEIK